MQGIEDQRHGEFRAMPFLLDHFLILTDPGAPEAELLTRLGLVEGSRNDHPGQGTANRRFFFHNTALELLYFRDAHESISGSARRLRIVDRASEARASPFGVILRATQGHGLPFPGWPYYPDYFGPETYFHVGENSDLLEEPLCVLMPANLPARASQPLSAEPFTVVTELRIGVPVSRPSSVLDAVGDIEGITIQLGMPHSMEVVFNDGRQGLAQDLGPDLPLRIRW